MPRDGYPCACRPGDWPHPSKCAHHAERDRLEAERGEQGPREHDYPNNGAYHRAYRRWRDTPALSREPADVDGPICHRATCVAEGDCGCADGGSIAASRDPATGKEQR